MADAVVCSVTAMIWRGYAFFRKYLRNARCGHRFQHVKDSANAGHFLGRAWQPDHMVATHLDLFAIIQLSNGCSVRVD
jgi:hypothetical protein